nr:MarR family transcriptional regulator [Maliibacterium massiliense]
MSEERACAMMERAYNAALRLEISTLAHVGSASLSMREAHIIEQVCQADFDKNENTMSALAQTMGVTISTLTVSVSTLERKGYLYRQRDTIDRRLVRVYATEEGARVNQVHGAMHQQQFDSVRSVLTADELVVFDKVMGKLVNYFEDQCKTVDSKE